MSDLGKRLARLAAVYRAPERPGWVAALEEAADERPERYAVLRVARLISMRRFAAETGAGPRGADLAQDAWVARVEAELDRLLALVARDGLAAGWAGWLGEGTALPPAPGWPVDLAAFYASQVAYGARQAAEARDALVRLGWRPA